MVEWSFFFVVGDLVLVYFGVDFFELVVKVIDDWEVV